MDSAKKALEYALRAAGYRMMSEKELKDKLLKKGFEEEDIEYAVEKVRSYGGLDDEGYAASLAAAYKNKGCGRQYVAAKLREKGISDDIKSEILEDFEPDYDKMRSFIASKLKNKQPDRKELGKISAALYRKGFSWEEIRKALREYRDNEDYYE